MGSSIFPIAETPGVDPNDAGLKSKELLIDKGLESKNRVYTYDYATKTVTVDLSNLSEQEGTTDMSHLFEKSGKQMKEFETYMGRFPNEMIIRPIWDQIRFEVTGTLDVYDHGVFLNLDGNRRIGIDIDGKMICCDNTGQMILPTAVDLKVLHSKIVETDSEEGKPLTKKFAEKIKFPEV